MPTLYVITGPAGVGKSTISKALAYTHSKSVWIEGDDIYHQVVGGYVQAWKEGNHLEVFWKVCMQSIKIYLEHGYDVIFNYIMTSHDFEEFAKGFADYSKKFIVLMVDEDILLKRDQERPEDCQMKERCSVLLHEFQQEKFPEKYILDTSTDSETETLAKIENGDFYF